MALAAYTTYLFNHVQFGSLRRVYHVTIAYRLLTMDRNMYLFQHMDSRIPNGSSWQ